MLNSSFYQGGNGNKIMVSGFKIDTTKYAQRSITEFQKHKET